METKSISEVLHEDRSGVLPFSIVRIDLGNILEYVSIALKEDDALISKFHFQDLTMEELILNNVKNIQELAKTKEVKCYGLFLEDTPIGFTVLCEKMLYSFGINVYCREPAIKAVWMKWLRRVFDNNFVVCLYRENTRAIKFFQRNGMEEFSDDGKVVYLITSKI